MTRANSSETPTDTELLPTPATTNLATPPPETAWSYVVELSGIAQAFQDFMREMARQDAARRPG
ncbi:MAG TPA: hypothetical protein VGG43_10025 [Acidimicrobiales bacterium]